MKWMTFRWFLKAMTSAQTCSDCNGIGAHVEAGDLVLCRACNGEGEL